MNNTNRHENTFFFLFFSLENPLIGNKATLIHLKSINDVIKKAVIKFIGGNITIILKNYLFFLLETRLVVRLQPCIKGFVEKVSYRLHEGGQNADIGCLPRSAQ